MKKILSLIVFVLALFFIINLTKTILKDPGIKREVKKDNNTPVSKVSSNEVNNMRSDIFNVYLNEERYKVKVDYIIEDLENETKTLNLKIYFDGKEILSKMVANKLDNLDLDIFRDENVVQNIILKESNFTIVKKEKDYLLILVGYLDNMGEYYLFNNKGTNLTEKGILAYDNTKIYHTENNEELTYFYDNLPNSRVKMENNDIFVLEFIKEKNIQIKEYKYNIKNDKIEKELINTYQNIKEEVVKEGN